MAESAGSELRKWAGRGVFRTLLPAGPRAGLVILIFHRVLRTRDPLQPSEPTAVEFERQMRWVRDWFNVLPLGNAVRRLAVGTLPERALAITFDDGYADNHDVALPILLKLDLPATFFIATGFLDGGRMFNDTVIEAVRRAAGAEIDLEELGLGICRVGDDGERVATMASILERVKYLPQTEREERVKQLAARATTELPNDLMMSSAQVVALDRAGMEIGAHTVTHPILSESSVEHARDEITSGRDYLQALIGRRIGLFAYPNGKPTRDYTKLHASLVRDLGFDAAVSTAWGCARAGSDVFQLPRFTPWDRSQWRYGARLARTIAGRSYSIA